MKQGKRYVEAAKLVDTTKSYEPIDALNLLVETATAKFDESVELHVRLGVDSRHADQQVRGVVVLPNLTCSSTDSSNLAVAVSTNRFNASAGS